ncbi:MAG: hypothetical protein AB7G13_10435 [Lautropia sp.]
MPDDRPTTQPAAPNPEPAIDLQAARRLVDALERDLAGIGEDRARVALLKAEIAELRRVLQAEEPPGAAMHSGLHGMRDRLHDMQDELKGDAIQAGRYLAEIGRVLGL